MVKNQGITFDEFVCLARCNGAIAAPSRYHQSSLAQFRATVQEVCSTPEGIHLVAAYSRQLFEQTGDGHFSPIGGYHAPRDLVLLLDVARFKYPPHWVPLALLWQAFEPLDPATNQYRGYITLRKNNNLQDTIFQVALDLQAWSKMAPNFADVLPTALERAQLDSPVAAVSIILQNFPEHAENIVGWALDHADLPQALQQAISAHRLFNVVEAALALPGRGISQWSRLQHSRERLTLLLLSCPDTLYQTLNPMLQTWFREARQPEQMEPLLAREIFKLREQISALQDLCQVQSLKPSARTGA
jgi:glutathione gamma-glutamylcysteinyltransferase